MVVTFLHVQFMCRFPSLSVPASSLSLVCVLPALERSGSATPSLFLPCVPGKPMDMHLFCIILLYRLIAKMQFAVHPENSRRTGKYPSSCDCSGQSSSLSSSSWSSQSSLSSSWRSSSSSRSSQSLSSSWSSRRSSSSS